MALTVGDQQLKETRLETRWQGSPDLVSFIRIGSWVGGASRGQSRGGARLCVYIRVTGNAGDDPEN